MLNEEMETTDVTQVQKNAHRARGHYRDRRGGCGMFVFVVEFVLDAGSVGHRFSSCSEHCGSGPELGSGGSECLRRSFEPRRGGIRLCGQAVRGSVDHH
jgi:hypothetical protein